ncbi:hypothetical protein Poly30_52610 [Planctomycetes bacterium Poly30]|uniref:Isoprenylcysteine carboxyl methyltransferase (ICMT) family protein n=2 Tax=Saltatorellus ferox TaxID=2528018 RepID=A0A518F037_9BACT|nr:hypothetical protein Poly30_52610 [Planctomycetes bacterium Poly30]
METQERSMPRVPWPPLLLLALAGLAYCLQRYSPLPLPDALGSGVARGIGFMLLGAALSVELWAAFRFYRRRTTVLPNRRAKALVTDGPYRVSRNPIYVAHVTIPIALMLAFTNPWMGLQAPVLLGLLTKLAIEPEEAFLRQMFGEAYDRYCDATRRWL